MYVRTQCHSVRMNTATETAKRITTEVVTRFANSCGIEASHLTDEPEALTAVEALAASRVLGVGVVFP